MIKESRRKLFLAALMLSLFLADCREDSGEPWSEGRPRVIAVDISSDVADPPFDQGEGTIADLPGRDGKISFREALIAANHTEGPARIQVSEAMDSPVIAVKSLLPDLVKADLVIDGMIHAPAGAKLTLDLSALPPDGHGLYIKASRVTLRNLRLQGFAFEPLEPSYRAAIAIFGKPPSLHPRSGVSIEDCELEGGAAYGIMLALGNMNNVQILRNRISLSQPTRVGIIIVAGTQNVNDRLIEKVLAAGNEVSGQVDFAFSIVASAYGGRNNEVREITVSQNHFHDILGGAHTVKRFIGICPNMGRGARAENGAIRDVNITENNCHDVAGSLSNGVWILGGNEQSNHGRILNLRISRNRFVNVDRGIAITDQSDGPGPGANRMEVFVEDNLFDNNAYSLIVRLNQELFLTSTLVLDWGGGPLGSQGRNLFLHAQHGLYIDPFASFNIYAMNNYWDDPSGPSDGDPAADADGIPDPVGAGRPVSEHIYWSPFRADAPPWPSTPP